MQCWLAGRYSSAYRIARFTILLGRIVQIGSVVLTVLAVIGVGVESFGGGDNVLIIRIVAAALFFILTGFGAGTCMIAAGQTSMALLDIAVNTSSFATPEEKAEILGTVVSQVIA